MGHFHFLCVVLILSSHSSFLSLRVSSSTYRSFYRSKELQTTDQWLVGSTIILRAPLASLQPTILPITHSVEDSGASYTTLRGGGVKSLTLPTLFCCGHQKQAEEHAAWSFPSSRIPAESKQHTRTTATHTHMYQQLFLLPLSSLLIVAFHI